MRLSIKEIEYKLQNENEKISDQFINEILADDRIGAQKAYQKWLTAQTKQQELKKQFNEMLQFEQEVRLKGMKYIAGVDEVGRGPLAGPVIAAAVILPEDFCLLGLTDSKKVTKKNREQFYEVIYEKAIGIGIGIINSAEIDRVNIYEATKLAMIKAISELPFEPEHLLIDAMKLPLSIPQTSIIKGDSKSISIAASSIVAKVTRDRYMEKLSQKYPHYKFEANAGYGTAEHLEALDEFGVCSEHRLSFAPVRERFSNRLF